MIGVIAWVVMFAVVILWLPVMFLVQWWKEPRCVDGTRNHAFQPVTVGGDGPMMGVARGYECSRCARCGKERGRIYVY